MSRDRKAVMPRCSRQNINFTSLYCCNRLLAVQNISVQCGNAKRVFRTENKVPLHSFFRKNQ